jgi:hypothetical protein
MAAIKPFDLNYFFGTNDPEQYSIMLSVSFVPVQHFRIWCCPNRPYYDGVRLSIIHPCTSRNSAPTYWGENPILPDSQLFKSLKRVFASLEATGEHYGYKFKVNDEDRLMMLLLCQN